jgi:NTE family protein
MHDPPAPLALVLAGGGARAAYQAGVLRYLARRFPDLQMPILSGVSAGAVNIATLANSTENFADAVERLTSLWSNISIDQVFHTGTFSLGAHLLQWALRLVSGGGRFAPAPRGLVDTAPMRRFFYDAYQTNDGSLPGIARNLEQGRLKAVAITSTNYATGQSVTWVQGEQLTMWERPLRHSLETTLTVENIMASCALPLFFPAIRLDNGWHGDGGVRLLAPLSPALHLGAGSILAISTRCEQPPDEAAQRAACEYPPPAKVIGVLMNAVFLDMLEYDTMTIHRLNALLRGIPEEQRKGLRIVRTLTLRPSCDLEALAAGYEPALPQPFRFLVRSLGTREPESSGLLATLMFTREYAQRLIEAGEQDGERQHDEIARFLDRPAE